MLKRNKDLGLPGNNPDDINYLSVQRCLAWLSKIEDPKGRGWDEGWALAGSKGTRLTCIGKKVSVRKPYAEIAHHTIGPCCPEILGTEMVYCLKRRIGSKWTTLIRHIAGECKGLIYRPLKEKT